MSSALFPPRKRFSVEEVERLLEAGFFVGERYELIDGELIDKRGQSPQHAFSIGQVMQSLVRVFGIEGISVQLPMQAGDKDRKWSMPEPDVAVLKELKREYSRRHPRGDELKLAVEVADSTVSWDLGRKMELYAHAAVPEYWVLDLPRRVIVAHRQPEAGEYKHVRTYSEDESIFPEGLSETISVRDLLPSHAQ